MRTAFLLTGNSQTYEYCFPSTKKHILDVYHPDVFLCTNEGHDKILSLYQPQDYCILPGEFILSMAMKLRVQKHGVPKYDLLKAKDLEANWKVRWCNLAKQQVEWSNDFRYDAVLVGRFDVKYCYVQPIEEVEESVIYIPMKDAHQ
jgi:peroxiredoxin family protein